MEVPYFSCPFSYPPPWFPLLILTSSSSLPKTPPHRSPPFTTSFSSILAWVSRGWISTRLQAFSIPSPLSASLFAIPPCITSRILITISSYPHFIISWLASRLSWAGGRSLHYEIRKYLPITRLALRECAAGSDPHASATTHTPHLTTWPLAPGRLQTFFSYPPESPPFSPPAYLALPPPTPPPGEYKISQRTQSNSTSPNQYSPIWFG